MTEKPQTFFLAFHLDTEHGVKILRNKDYKTYVDYVKMKYGSKFLNSLKNKNN